MTKEQCDFLEEVFRYQDEETEIRDDYSGRSMYGKKTYGIVLDNPGGLLGMCIEYIKYYEVPYDEIPELNNLKTDSMGMSYIIY